MAVRRRRAAAIHQSNLSVLRPCVERQRQTQAKFECVECGFEENADLVGAINIPARGHRVLACGEPVQSGRSDEAGTR